MKNINWDLMKKILFGFFYLIFWSWNLIFLMVVYFGLLPQIGLPLIQATFDGNIPFDFVISLIAFILVPTICTLIGWNFRSDPVKLMRLFYGAEIPLVILCFLRLFIFREVNIASGQIICTILICAFVFMFELLHGYAKNNPLLAGSQFVVHSLMLVIGIWGGLVLLFYAIPVLYWVLYSFITFEWLRALIDVIFRSGPYFFVSILFMILFMISAVLFTITPVAIIGLYIDSYRKINRLFMEEYGKQKALLVRISTVTSWLILFFALQNQPQITAFKLLEKAVSNDGDRQTILPREKIIKEGLINAYLSSYRYLSSVSDSNSVFLMYKQTFNLSDQAAQFVQSANNILMSPFLYQGDQNDDQKAAKLYAKFFDQPLQKAEQSAVINAVKSTYSGEDAKAGVLNINQHRVLLNEQKITVKPQGDWAEIELYEVYENQTTQDEEIFYSFSLPESAVITGLWLGNSDKLNERYPYIVSTRGAAQKVYNNEVKKRVDPALLEQVGPRHYRLRAFPVLRRLTSSEMVQFKTQPKLHLWLTYKVMQQEKGWMLPQLGEKRNIFWDFRTKRNLKSDDWLPNYIPAESSLKPQLHQVNFEQGYQITAKPINNYSLPEGDKFAVIVDTSFSMRKHQKEVKDTWELLQSLKKNDLDLYVSKSEGLDGQKFDDLNKVDPQKITYYGSLKLKEMLEQFVKLKGDNNYDGILLITDEGSYELSKDEKIKSVSSPLWLVHLGGKLPPAYDDAILRIIQDSGGGVSTDIKEVMSRIATQSSLGKSILSVVDGYGWYLEKLENKPVENITKNSFQQITARYLVMGLSREKAENKLTQLDQIHAIAKKFDIVTPYSSMIVLVNDGQKKALKEAEKQADRFDRKVESGQEVLSKPSNPLNTNVSGVPEPEEWMLLGIGSLALIFVMKKSSKYKLRK